MTKLPCMMLILLLLGGCAGASMPQESAWVSLFDGQTLDGWEGSDEFFRVEDGAIVGGRRADPIPRNEFLCREEEYGDFEMQLAFRLEPEVNSGVQIRSQRIPGSHEAIGYQADLGEGYWGAIYDESRRNRVLIAPDAGVIEEVLEPTGWNDYRILAEGPRIRLFINGQETVDYVEEDASIPQRGRVCVQIHSGPPGEVRFRELRIRELRTPG